MVVEKLVLGMCSTNCYVVYDQISRAAVIIDPAANPVAIKNLIVRLNIKPMAILLTHGHFDHILAAEEIKKEYDIKIYASEAESQILTDSNNNLSVPFTGEPFVINSDVGLKAGEELKIGPFRIKLIAVPGHTIGGMCYYFEEAGTLFSGDTLFAGSVGRHDFPTGNGLQLLTGIKDKLFTLPEETICYSGHGELTTIGYEKENNPFFGL